MSEIFHLSASGETLSTVQSRFQKLGFGERCHFYFKNLYGLEEPRI